ncbi:DUF4426 domain-containing protein [Neptunomonas qingdaonensis]|uniref:DUF4426 domain-containing protein n=1 Tax=Neptunomonas qingdaonensis TaxID=1045558 RepID=A0A1I2M025_9GAMM|nr:DUF4426 domain-containing protein [Neptunomonas qingdaonensis]SFF84865.1 protein of unknown function [Neptunomonas qingdaonensis]
MKLLRTLFLLLLTTQVAVAEQSIETERYVIHYNAFNSSLVAPEVAQKHQLQRSRYTAMLNVAVFEKQDDGTQQAVSAMLSGEVANLMQQTQKVTFTPIKEDKALYYIGSFRFGNEEVMHLVINVQPDPNQPATIIRFDQKFYTE